MPRLVIKYMVFIAGLMVSTESLGQNAARNLLRVDSAYQAQQLEANIRIEQYLKKNRIGRVAYRSDGTIMALVDVSESGVPIYIKSDNAGVATSLSVDQLRNGGNLGLNLEGQGIQVAIWDEGKVRNDHIEYNGRVAQMDSPSGFNRHATHVMGTILGAGINSNAKGMAPKATALAYDFFSDVSEMTSQAKPDQTSIILSNHSYGTLSGWDKNGSVWTWYGDASISSTRDWKFGFYNSTSGLYDEIAYNAPYYLIVKSAGNDNSDTGDGSKPPDCDPFDCIPTNGVAKNILTVGAVKKLTDPYTNPSDVQITSFSSFGPTDDGRIKPDIVAPGQNVFSSTSASASSYEALSGTSMSAPATTGTLVLLQELYKNLHGGNLMKAATLKALVIHTAREAGENDGPDYRFGWGLLDAEAAAKTIIDSDDLNVFVKELSINNGEVYELNLQPKENTKITSTLVWNDPAGQVLAPALNPTTKMLKNDLDLRLVDDGNTMQFPWKLDPSNPAAAATKGDNAIDNIEKLELDNPEPRNYKLRVSHKGTLINGKQDFSLIITYTSLIDSRVSYYWIGNTGNWDNGANWSLSSGGVAANVVPGSDDKVVFDENSFTSDNQIVSLTQPQQCYSLRWFANEQISLSLNSHQLTIKDGLNLLSKNISSITPGVILFEGTIATDAIVNLNDNNLDDLALKFSGLDARWQITGDFKIDQIEVIEGNVTIGEHHIQLNDFIASGILSKTLTLNRTTLSGVSNTLSLDFSNVLLDGEEIQIEVPSLATYNLDVGTNTFDGSIELMGGQITVTGSGVIQSVNGFGVLIIDGNLIWDDIVLNQGTTLNIKEGTTQVITGVFDLQASVANRITIVSPGSSVATIMLEAHNKICLDNLNIENVAVTGEATVNAGTNSKLINSPNWLQASCSSILFPDFDFEFNCEKASVFFKDKSSGPIVSWRWNFGDANSNQNLATTANPIHFFEGQGQFDVSLEISDGVNNRQYTKKVQLNETILPANKVELSNGRLISFLPANKYQWVLNGELLQDTNLRSIDFTAGQGEYAVLTFDENCNRRSDTFLVTAVNGDYKVEPIEVYPNPVDHSLFIEDGEINFIKLVNYVGQEVNTKPVSTEKGWRLDVSDLPAGIYILKIQSSNNWSARRIVVR